MTNITNKPKRKVKPKHVSHRRWIVLFILFVLAVASQIMVSVFEDVVTEAVISSELCNMDVDYPYLIHDEFNNTLFLSNINSLGTIQDMAGRELPNSVLQPVWFASGDAFVYQTQDGNHYSTHLYNTETYVRTAFDDDSYYSVYKGSPDGRYMLQSGVVVTSQYDGEKIRIIDKEHNKIVFETYTVGTVEEWSIQSSYVFFNGLWSDPDFLIDVKHNNFIILDFLDDRTRFLGWISDDAFVFRDALGILQQYNVTTETTNTFLEGVYPQVITGDLFENFHSFGHGMFGMFDDDFNYWMIDLNTQTREYAPDIVIDWKLHSGSGLVVHRGVLNITYVDEKKTKIFEVQNGYQSVVNQPRPLGYPFVSEYGEYFSHWLKIDDEKSIAYVQGFNSDEKTTINDEKTTHLLRWMKLDNQDYLYFVLSDFGRQSDTYTHYLYNPSTQQACIVTKSYAPQLIWQPQN